ncbi:hypothetical protein KLP28_07900 [Nocardioidaceae bacterium]|nr:hypothetical protein KLP28_07900 [Nocardioidaceae bacterium]
MLRLRPQDPPIVGAWRHAARALTLATAALQRAESKPWEDDKSAAWHLLGDLAMTTAAMCSLDDRLGAQEILPRLSGNARIGRQLSLLDVAGLADAWGRNPAADTIAPSVGAQTAGNAAIRIVRTSADLPGALISLAAALHGDPSMPGVTGAHTRAGLRALRTVAVGQAQLSLAYARGADAMGDEEIAVRFRGRAHAYADLHRSCVKLRDHMPDRGQKTILQQREITLLVRRSGRLEPASADTTPHTLAQLDRAVAQRVLAIAHEGLVGATRQTQESVTPRPPFLALDSCGDAMPATQRTRLAKLMRTLPGAPMRSLGR